MWIKENGIYRIYKIIFIKIEIYWLYSCCFLKIELLFLFIRLYSFNVFKN